MVDALSVAALLGTGLTAGVLFCVALSVLPALFALPPDRYVQTHVLLGRNYDPVMPLIVLSSFAADLALAVLAGGASRALFAGSAAVLLGVSGVSHLLNVPLNRRVRALDIDHVPSDWQDPRPLWRRWHLLRTWLAVLALAGNGCAVVLPA